MTLIPLLENSSFLILLKDYLTDQSFRMNLKKHITLLELFKQDLKVVATVFMEGKALVESNDERAPISNNLPPISGALNWTTGLLERIKEPMEKLSLLSQSIQDREEYKDVQKLYSSLCKNLREYNE